MDVGALARRSVEVIRDNQAERGAYVASPTFAPYRYSWFRDGSFIADAMSRVGEVESAEAFFDWCSRVILERREREWLAARYRLEGEDDAAEWPHLQHDGYGLWLWAARAHLERHGRPAGPWRDAVDVTAAYLVRVWREPCTDWWEERTGHHAATLACIVAGLRAWEVDERVDLGLGEDRTDASRLVLVPLGLGGAEVVERVERELVSPGGGVHRHREDIYYGGGEWLLLTALLGWAYALTGSTPRAREKLDWVAAHATLQGDMPEQSQDHLLHPDSWQPWVDRWGPPPSPLLWSHAMFLTLAHELGEA
jgi:GH15 family glucan-1,4-alpha-glucosidase